MKFNVIFNTPEVCANVIDMELKKLKEQEWSEEDIENFKERMEFCVNKFARFGSFISVEFDTETGEASVLPARGRNW